MADQTTNYQIAVTDGVDPAIERRLVGISTAADRAGVSCASLQANLNKLDAAGISGVATALRDSNTASKQAVTAAQAQTQAFGGSTRATNALGASLSGLRNNIASTIPQLQVLTTTVQGLGAAIRSTASASSGGGGLPQVGQGAQSAAGGLRNMNAALTVGQGRIGSANRLAASFLNTLVGASPIIAAAFQVLGVLALVAVLAQVASAVYNVVRAYEAQAVASREASTQAILDGEKIIRIQTSIFTAANLARVFRGNGLDTGDLQIQSAAAAARSVAAQKEILESQLRLNEAGKTGIDLANERVRSAQTELEFIRAQKAAADGLVKSYVDQLNAKRTVTQVSSGGTGGAGFATTSEQLVITDPTKVKALQTELRAAQSEADKLGTALVVAGNAVAAAGKKEGLVAVKDAAKDARLEMQQLEKGYRDYLTTLDHKITPNEALAYWQNAERGLRHYGENIDAVNGKESVPLQQIASRNDNLGRTNENLDDQIKSIGSYSDALKAKQQLDRLTLEYQRTGIPLTAQETQQLREKISIITQSASYQAALNAEYNAGAGPLRTYLATQDALSTLMKEDPANLQKYQAQLSVANRTYRDANDPLARYNEGLRDQISLLGTYGTVATVAAEVQQQQNALRERGYSLTKQETDTLREQLTVIENAKAVNADINQLYNANAGQVQANINRQQALDEAYNKNIITLSQYKQATLDLKIQQDQLANNQGLRTYATSVSEILNKLKGDFRDVGTALTQSFGNVFATLQSGFADGIGHAIAFGGSIKEALGNVARQAIAGLISSLITLGIQFVIVTALQKLFGITLPKTATSAKDQAVQAVVAIGAIAAITTAQLTAIELLSEPAWSLAEAVSLFSFGANAIPAEAGIAAVVAAGTAAKFAAGGIVRGPGTSTSDSIPARLSTGEYVINARATAEHHSLLDAINSNRKLNTFASGGYVAGSQVIQQTYLGNTDSSSPRLVIEDHTNGVKFVPVGASHDEVRVIARQVVRSDAPGVVGASFSDGNSPVRKGLHANTTATPRRD